MQSGNGDNIAEPIRLNRFLAMCGLGSRRKCDEIISSGKVYVNGQRATELGVKVDPTRDSVEYLGETLNCITQMKYLAYYKPVGIIVTKHDPEGRTTIYQDIEAKGVESQNLKYAGRLDYNSEGLLVLTNDGDLIHALTHPRFGIKKVYEVKTRKPLTKEDSQQLIAGVPSKDQILRAGGITGIEGKNDPCWVKIDLYEGKNRQIRRMLEAVGNEVLRLKRIQFSSVKLGAMKPGEIRELTEKEIRGVRNTGYKK